MYIILEGIDTSGKSTQIALLKKHFPDAYFTREPGGSELGIKLREILLHSPIHSPAAEMFLFLADRAEHAHTLPKNKRDQLIISDRGLVSGIAYAADFELDMQISLNKIALQDRMPDKIVLLWLEKETLQSRLSQKEHDRIEEKGIDALLAIQSRMKACLEHLAIPYLLQPAEEGIDTIHANIVNFIESNKGASS